MLLARLFGPLELAVDGRQLGPRDLGGRKPRQLLEILLVERGHVVPKDRLADLLWGDALPANVAATLDTYASTLRGRLEPDRRGAGRYVVGGGGGLLVPADVVDLDLDRFDDLVGRARAWARGRDRTGGGDRDGRAVALATLESALALVRGQVLEDEPYASWALQLRDRYAQREVDARLAAAEHALAGGQPDAALAHAQAVLAVDEVTEPAHRLVMLACYRLGRQEEALRAYDRCRRVLADELGVDPLPETAGLHAAILRHDDSAVEVALRPPAERGGAHLTGPPAGSEDELPFLGRGDELATLAPAARRALAGSGGLLVVEGEAGIGKTRLVAEVLDRLGPLRVGAAKCAEVDRDLPYVPLAAALRDLGAPALAAAATAPALGEILPELPPSGLPPETARVRALESVAALLGSLAPVAVFIDDLQWGDASTVAALAYLQRRCADRAVLLLAAVRPEEVAPDSPVAGLAPTARVRVGPLTEVDVAPLGDRADPAALLARSGGNPLWLGELLRAGDDARAGPPPRLAELIVARCRRAGPGAHRLLAAAALLGRPFGPELAAALAGGDPLEVAEQLEDLEHRGLVRPAGGAFAFRHDLIADALAARVSPARRRLVHARAVAVLEAAGASAGELAGHAVAAALPEPALRWSIAAAEAARRACANVEAAQHYRRAVRIADAHPELTDAPERERLRVALASALVTLGQVDEAEAALDESRASAERRGDERSQFAAVEGLAVARQRGASDPVAALALGREALAIARRIGDPALIARGHTLVGSPSGSLGLLDDEVAECTRAVTIDEQAGRAPAAYPMGRIALGLHHQGREADALAWAGRAEAAATGQHDEETLLVAHWVRALACGALGRVREAWAALDACAAVGRGEEVFWHARLPNTYGSMLADLCLFAAALERDVESLEVTGSSPAGPVREAEFQTRLNLAADHLGLGDPEAASRQLEPVRAGAGDVVYARFRWLARLRFLEAELAAAEGSPEEAQAAAHACLALAAEHGQPKYEVRGHLALAGAHLAAGERHPARRHALAAAGAAEALGYPALAWRSWSAASRAGAGPRARDRARAAVRRAADGLDEPLRGRFLAAVPVDP